VIIDLTIAICAVQVANTALVNASASHQIGGQGVLMVETRHANVTTGKTGDKTTVVSVHVVTIL
jgi:hypothetical protein